MISSWLNNEISLPLVKKGLLKKQSEFLYFISIVIS